MIDGTFDAVFFTFVITSGISCFLGLARMLYKSKCKSCSFCGIEIERDVEIEEREDMAEPPPENSMKRNEESKI